MSSPMRSFGMARSFTTIRCAVSLGSAPQTWSTGRSTSTFLDCARSRICRARSSLSASTRLLPTSTSCAARNVYAIAPPTQMASAFASRFSSTLILSETLAPPMIATNGRAGLPSALPRYSSSFWMRKPAAFSFTNFAMPAVEACARCAVPNASFTQTSASAASSFANPSSFFSSSGWNRRFSRSSTCPSLRSRTSFTTPSPTQSSARMTSLRSSSESRAAAGSSDSFWRSSGFPFGRPRCEARITRPRALIAYWIVGSAARMRASSVTRPCSSSGTLKSTRMKTRLPARSSASMVFITMASLLREVLRDVDHAVREAPLVVVPGEDLRERPVDDEGARRVEDRGRRVAVVVDRDGRLLGVPVHALQRALGGLLKRRVDLLDRRRLLELDREVDERDVRRRDAHGRAVELPLERRDHLGDRLGGAGGGRDHRQRRGARAAQVLVRQVEEVLVVRVRVDRRHEPVVDAVGHGEVGVLRRRRDEHPRRAGLEVALGLLPIGEEAGALEDEVHLVRGVGEVRRRLDRRDLDLLPVHHDPLLRRLHVGIERTVDGVVLEEVRERLRVGQVVDGDELEVLLAALERSANDTPTDATEPVDCDARHVNPSQGSRKGAKGREKRRLNYPPPQGASTETAAAARASASPSEALRHPEINERTAPISRRRPGHCALVRFACARRPPGSPGPAPPRLPPLPRPPLAPPRPPARVRPSGPA